MKRKLFSLAITLAVLTLTSVGGSAAAGSTVVTTALDFTDEAVCAEYAAEKDGILWDSEEYRLTLHNAAISVADGTALTVPSWTEILLLGSNSITVGSGETSIGILVPGEAEDWRILNICGSGSLTVTVGDAEQSSIGIMTGYLNLESCTVTVNAGAVVGEPPPEDGRSCGVFADDSIDMEKAHLTVGAKGMQACAICSGGRLEMDSDCTLTASHDASGVQCPSVKACPIIAVGAIVGAEESFESGKTEALTMQDTGTAVTLTFPNICAVGETEYRNLKTAVIAAGGIDTVRLTADVTLGSALAIDKEENVTLDLNGHLLSVFPDEYTYSVIDNDGTLTVTDSNGAVQRKWVPDANGLWVPNDSAAGTEGTDYFITNGGCISSGYGSVGISNAGTLTINAGNIVGCCGLEFDEEDGFGSGGDGGGIYMSQSAMIGKSTLSMTGGRICGNAAEYGAGIYLTVGEITLTGGSIDRNTAVKEDWGYGFSRGGEGGGVVLMNGTLTVDGGSINRNTAHECAGGVYVDGGAVLTVTKGSIDCNSAASGGGIYVATSSGWDWELEESYTEKGTVKLCGGSVKDNTASEQGGGISLNGELFIGGDADISGNKNGEKDSNVYLWNGSYITLGNGTGEEANGVPAPSGMKAVGISVSPYASDYAVTQAGSGDGSQWFKADSVRNTVKFNETDENVILAEPDYALYLKDGRIRKDNADGEDMTDAFASEGLSYDSDTGTWRMENFVFSATTAQPFIFADDSAALSVAGGCYIVAIAVGETVSITAENLNVTGSGEDCRLSVDGISAASLTVTGDVFLTAYGNVTAQTRPEAYVTPIVYSDSFGWDEDSGTFAGVEVGLYLTKLVHFNGGFGNESCTFDSYVYGNIYQIAGADRIFSGWYSGSDFNPERLKSAEDADYYENYAARWLTAKTFDAPVAEDGLVSLEASDAVAAVLPSDVSGMTALRVKLENASVTFDGAALGAVKTNAGSGSVVLTVGLPDMAADEEAYLKALSDSTDPKLVTVSMTVGTIGGEAVFGTENAAGTVKLTVPYDNYDGRVTAYCLEGGKAVAVPCSYDTENQTATLTLKHFSEYVIVTKYSGGSGGGTTYRIADETIGNGTVTISYKRASAGRLVTVTPKPDKGWLTETVTVYDGDGSETTVTPDADGKRFTFRMPRRDVTVSVSFMEDNTMLNYFFDVRANDYFYDAVLWAAENSITGGVGASRFSPAAPTDRAQMVTLLWRAAGSPTVDAAMSFSDVPANAWYAEAVRWAASEGITVGTGGNTFSPHAGMTRAQAVTLLWRYEGSKTGSAAAAFADVPSDAYYSEAVLWAAAQGITSGTSKTTFSPKNLCTRGEAVTLLYRDIVG